MGKFASSTDSVLARAVIYRALSAAFGAPSDAAPGAIGGRDGFAAVAAALRCQQEAAGADRNALARAAARLEAFQVADAETISRDYWRLFGHTTRGLVCACETEYGPDNGFHQPQQLADIVGYYLAFGVRPPNVGEVRPDHIACECEFMDLLNRKQARLIEDAGSTDAAETLEATVAAERSFFRGHLGRFGRAFGARVASEDPGGFHGLMGQVLLAFLESESARLGVAAGPTDLAVRPDEVDDAPMACGTGDHGAEQFPLAVYRRTPSTSVAEP